MDWHQKFGHNSGCKVVKLTGETGTDLKLIAKGQIIRFNFTYNASRIAAMSKPVYNAVTKFSPHKPVIARSRKLDRITDQGEHKPFLDRMANRMLKETLSQGVAYIHEGLTESDHHIVEQLFDFGAV
ncbi:U520 [Culex quinquefasciatus]|uniref:U520 n=1 Tax=Culex quinquefasciatus TaxID=7176 RepID=B0WR68_CULQU|nr:U520 [Culex quinquefasciatus]|eukprot:XP_001851202.1 U520 [Culex quinquefasciatus]